MVAWIPNKTCNPRKWGCGRAFPETAAYFRPLNGEKRGYFHSYCHDCCKRRQQLRRKPKTLMDPYGAVKGCLGEAGCGRMLRESDFYRERGICRSCYGARWVACVREKKQRERERLKSFKLGHRLTDRSKGPFVADAEELPGAAGHSVWSEDAMHELLEMACPRNDGN